MPSFRKAGRPVTWHLHRDILSFSFGQIVLFTMRYSENAEVDQGVGLEMQLNDPDPRPEPGKLSERAGHACFVELRTHSDILAILEADRHRAIDPADPEFGPTEQPGFDNGGNLVAGNSD